jgi:SAM-dependent methyltransferase
MEICPLCKCESDQFYKDLFYICRDCKGIFRPAHHYPDPRKEKERYDLHRNDVFDEGYRHFVSPVTNEVLKCFLPKHKGLDFGSGPSSAVSRILEENGYDIKQFDPCFNNVRSLLKVKYDYVICCEVIEHFHYPEKEFAVLKELLQPHGVLLCMTFPFEDSINFNSWYYKNDLTHVFIYQKLTFEWIRNHFGFSGLDINDRLIIFHN